MTTCGSVTEACAAAVINSHAQVSSRSRRRLSARFIRSLVRAGTGQVAPVQPRESRADGDHGRSVVARLPWKKTALHLLPQFRSRVRVQRARKAYFFSRI